MSGFELCYESNGHSASAINDCARLFPVQTWRIIGIGIVFAIIGSYLLQCFYRILLYIALGSTTQIKASCLREWPCMTRSTTFRASFSVIPSCHGPLGNLPLDSGAGPLHGQATFVTIPRQYRRSSPLPHRYRLLWFLSFSKLLDEQN
jgi:hypothetical protein